MANKKVPGRAGKHAPEKALPSGEPGGAVFSETTDNALSSSRSKKPTLSNTETKAETKLDTENAQALSESIAAAEIAAQAATSVGPPTALLKDKFSAQKIPLQTDFFSFIDVADCGRFAAGLSPDQPGGTGAGLRLDEDRRLEVRGNANKAIEATAAGVSVIANAAKAIEATSSGIGVRTGSNMTVSNGLLSVVNNAFYGQNFSLPPGMSFDNVVPPAYQPGVYGIQNNSSYPNRPGNENGYAGNGFLQLFSHGPSQSVDVTQIYFNAIGQMWLRSKHDAATGFTPWTPIARANANKAIESTDNGVGVIANAGRAIMVDGSGVGINYGSTLQVTSNRLEVSNSVLERQQLTNTINTATPVWRRIISIPSAAIGAYAKLHVMAWNSKFKQRFIISIYCDGSVNYGGGKFSMSVSNVQREGNYAIESISLGIEYYQQSIVELYISKTGEPINLMIDYALSDIKLASVLNFVSPNMLYRYYTFSTGANGAYQS